MPSFSVNVHRFDPYKGFKFRVRWDGRAVPDVHRVSGLRWAPPRPWPAPAGPGLAIDQEGSTGRGMVGGAISDVLDRVRNLPSPRASARPAPVPQWARLVIDRGRTHDAAFEQWAAQAVAAARNGQSSEAVRKDIVVEVQNEAGQTALAFRLFGCVPVEYLPIGDLDANRCDVLTERLVLEYDRAERDLDVPEPTEPSFAPRKG